METTQNKIKNNWFSQIDKTNKSVLKQYLIVFAIWAVVVFVMLTIFGLYTYEVMKINSTMISVNQLNNTEFLKPGIAYSISEWKANMYHYDLVDQQKIFKAMVEGVFGNTSSLETAANMPIIWFSNMYFIPSYGIIVNYQSSWDSKMLTITTCQVYMLISTVVAIIGAGIYVYLLGSYGIKLSLSKKRGFTNKYPLYVNDMGVFTTKTYLNFFIAISIFFSFYSLSATIVMLLYMLIIKIIYKEIEKRSKETNVFKASDLNYFFILFIIMLVMIAYKFATSFFMKWLEVDISVVLDTLFTAGGIAVVIFGLIKSLLESSITQIKKKMNTIDNQIKQIRFFYRVSNKEAAKDFSYVEILPPLIKHYIATNKSINQVELDEIFKKLFEYTDFIKEFNMGKSKKNKKRKNFILYRMYNEITTIDEVEDIKVNLIKEFEQTSK